MKFYLNNPKENGKVHYSHGHTAAHGHSGTLGRGAAARPKAATFGVAHVGGRGHCAARTRTVCGHRGEAHPAWCVALRHSGVLSVMRNSAQPSLQLRLHAATPTHRQRQRERGSHRGSGGLVVTLAVEVDKRLQTWTKALGLGSLAAQARHEH
jgi:hypothetical protein